MSISATGNQVAQNNPVPDAPTPPGKGADTGEMYAFQQQMTEWSLQVNALFKALETEHQAKSAAVNRTSANIR